MGTIRFSLRKDKTNNQGKHPIELIYQVKGQRKYFRTKEKILPDSWDISNQRVIYLDKKTAKNLAPQTDYKLFPTDKEVKSINGRLEGLIHDITDIEELFENKLNQVEYSSEMVVDRLKQLKKPLTKKEEPSNLVFDFIDKYIEENKSIREPGSLSVYKSLRNHLQAFQKGKGVKISFQEIDAAFFRRFQSFLVTPREVYVSSKKPNTKGKWKIVSLNNTTVAKQLSTLKTFLNYAKAEGKKVSDKYRDFKITKPKLEVIALTNDEFETLYNFDLSKNKRLDQVRDVFCFSCVTGFRYSDLAQLRSEHIKKDEIRITVKKTKVELTVPLNPYSKAILLKYKERHYPLPVISNQKLNSYIKELCKIAGINDPVEIVRQRGNKKEANVYPKHALISIHVGRKTFVTLSLKRGMSAQEVMKISGHENYESFKRYLKITEEHQKEAMKKAWGTIRKPVKKQAAKLKAV